MDVERDFCKATIRDLLEHSLVRPADWTGNEHQPMTGAIGGTKRIRTERNRDASWPLRVRVLRRAEPYEVTVTPNDTVLSVKERLQPLCGLAPADQRLVVKGRVLKNSQKLMDAGVTPDTPVHLFRLVHFATAPLVSQTDTAASREFWTELLHLLRARLSDSTSVDKVMQRLRDEYATFLGACNEDDLRRLVSSEAQSA